MIQNTQAPSQVKPRTLEWEKEGDQNQGVASNSERKRTKGAMWEKKRLFTCTGVVWGQNRGEKLLNGEEISEK